MISLVSVIIPTLDEEHNIVRTLNAVHRAAAEVGAVGAAATAHGFGRAKGAAAIRRAAGVRRADSARGARTDLPATPEVEVLVVDGGSRDRTVALSRELGAHIVTVPAAQAAQNPALLRNRGAAAAEGELLVFLDADCEPQPGWLVALLAAHADGWKAVGGGFGLPKNLSASARCDYYAGWYNVHERRAAGPTVSAPPGNLSIEAATFRRTTGYDETPGIAYSHEELRFQGELRRAGILIYFEPAAVVLHHNRAGVANLLARHYRWGYAALQSKATTGSARAAWAYRHPWALVFAALPLALPLSLYVAGQWIRAGVWSPVAWLPAILVTRVAYGAGMMIGGARWLLARQRPGLEPS
jgi:glycosyltransferase involved in cell wall biosynthesis